MEREKLIQLVSGAQSGNKAAFDELFNAFYTDVYNIALRETKKTDIAADVTQETFIEVIQTIDRLAEPAAFVSWLKAITYHQCTRYYKKKENKHERLIDESDDNAPTVFELMEEENEEFIPDKALANKELCAIIRNFVEQLPDAQRAAVMMKYFEGMSVKQIAVIQGVSENTVLSRLYYARNALKAEVEAYEKKHNIKLHGIPFLPLVRFLFTDKPKPVSTKIHKRIAKGVSSSTGVSVSTAAGAVAGIPVAVKVLAAILAGVVVTGAAGVGIPAAVRKAAEAKQQQQQQMDDTLDENPGENPDELLTGNPIENGRLDVWNDFFKGKSITDFYFNINDSSKEEIYVITDDGPYTINADLFSDPTVKNLLEEYPDVADWSCSAETGFYYWDHDGNLYVRNGASDNTSGRIFYTYGRTDTVVSYSIGDLGHIYRDGWLNSSDGQLFFVQFKKILGINLPVKIFRRVDNAQTVSYNRGRAYATVLVRVGNKSYVGTLSETNLIVRLTALTDALGSEASLLSDCAYIKNGVNDQLFYMEYTTPTTISLPDGHTTDQITYFGGGDVKMMVFDNGDVYRWDSTDPHLPIKDEGLSLIGDQIQSVTHNEYGTFYFLMKDGTIYRMR